ncbi:MAG: putative selenium-dependent hydroxylase accessory protein YqeC [Oscillospiraceae bacterium]|nr:putative selenium-dependent hydroxylase accessory protein YqeC [Oscillospiraceae bacterium]
MELWELLSVRPGVTALVGGGGKTTAMYTLARELAMQGTVACTTTTHILPPSHMPVLDCADRGAVSAALAAHGCICLGALSPEGKLTAPAMPVEAFAPLADYVLVEADGSKRLPVKAHLPHEPVIPACAGSTIVLAGASGFGRPIREAVHRWERFCRLAGASPEMPVTAENLAAVLAAEGLGDAYFINQAETLSAMAEARRLAKLLLRPVFAGSLRGGIWECLS